MLKLIPKQRLVFQDVVLEEIVEFEGEKSLQVLYENNS